VLAPVPGHIHVFDLESGDRLTDRAIASA
jgi:multiple sugar transport system ATP-binding protein